MSGVDLVTFLRARLDEREAAAKAATPGPWWANYVALSGGYTVRGGPGKWRGFDGSLGGDTRPIARIEPAPDDEGGYVTNHDADAAHIALNDPAYVLADVAAKRRIVDWCEQAERLAGEPPPSWAEQARRSQRANDLFDVVKLLAAAFASHPDYAPAWATVPMS